MFKQISKNKYLKLVYFIYLYYSNCLVRNDDTGKHIGIGKQLNLVDGIIFKTIHIFFCLITVICKNRRVSKYEIKPLQNINFSLKIMRQSRYILGHTGKIIFLLEKNGVGLNTKLNKNVYFLFTCLFTNCCSQPLFHFL